MSAIKWLAAWFLVLAVLAGCSHPLPSPQPTTDERFGAPEILSPRDVRPFAADPCAGPLKPAEWEALGFSAAGDRQTLTVGENSCDREGPESTRYVALIVAGSRDVLVQTYRTRLFTRFQPIQVGGLPGVAEQNSEQDVSCTVSVGTAQDQGFVLNYSEYRLGSDGQPQDPCGRAQQVAERIVAALPPLAGK